MNHLEIYFESNGQIHGVVVPISEEVTAQDLKESIFIVHKNETILKVNSK